MASPPMATDADLDRVVVVAAGGVVGVGLAAAPRRLGVPAHLRSPRVAAEPLVLGASIATSRYFVISGILFKVLLRYLSEEHRRSRAEGQKRGGRARGRRGGEK